MCRLSSTSIGAVHQRGDHQQLRAEAVHAGRRARHERAGAGAAYRDCVANHKGELAGEDPGDLVAVMMPRGEVLVVGAGTGPDGGSYVLMGV
jgi:hypothetical protein